MKFQKKIIFINTSALKLAVNNDNKDIFQYLLSLPGIEIIKNCFTKCKNLTKLSIPLTVTYIGDYAFSSCFYLKEITIPPSVTLIGNYAFENCRSLTKIIIPSSVTSIGDYVFKNCKFLTEMIVPPSVTSIGDYFISKCFGLKEIKIPITTKIGKLYFQDFKNITELIIPSSVTIISENSFGNCRSLQKVEIPSTVTKIERLAFTKCVSLTEITIPPSVTFIGDCAFEDCQSLTKIIIPSSVTSIGDNAFKNCKCLTEITIPPSVTSIQVDTFAYCFALSKVNLPSKLTAIGNDAFLQCRSLVYITIPSSIKYIGSHAFDRCVSLKKIILNKDFKKIKMIYATPNDVKVAVVGGPNVGKTSIIERIAKNRFPDTKMNAHFENKILDIDGIYVKLELLDTSCAQTQINLTKLYINRSYGAIVVLDLNNRDSLNYAKMFLETINDSTIKPPTILLGNKAELNHNIYKKDIEELLTIYNSKYFEVSALKNNNIEDAIMYLGSEILKKYETDECSFKDLICYDDSFLNQFANKCSIY